MTIRRGRRTAAIAGLLAAAWIVPAWRQRDRLVEERYVRKLRSGKSEERGAAISVCFRESVAVFSALERAAR